MTATDLRDLPALEIRNACKQYRLGEHVSLRATLAGLRLQRDRTRAAHPVDEVIDALTEVSLTVPRGDCVGLVGVNGSGKSSLAQLIAGISLPNSGSVTVRGRVLPLLSVGSSFHPELTGRENVQLFGAILGIDAQTSDEAVNEAAAFAEVETHLDTPMKRYSDGMQARLSFAVGVLFPADVYIFDEVLAVVDAEFRDRCLDAIAGLSAAGRTVVFVSHSQDQVVRVCNRVVWLDHGEVRADGPTADVVPVYREAVAEEPTRLASART